MFGRKKHRHHRSDFFLGQWENLEPEGKKEPVAPKIGEAPQTKAEASAAEKTKTPIQPKTNHTPDIKEETKVELRLDEEYNEDFVEDVVKPKRNFIRPCHNDGKKKVKKKHPVTEKKPNPALAAKKAALLATILGFVALVKKEFLEAWTPFVEELNAWWDKGSRKIEELFRHGVRTIREQASKKASEKAKTQKEKPVTQKEAPKKGAEPSTKACSTTAIPDKTKPFASVKEKISSPKTKKQPQTPPLPKRNYASLNGGLRETEENKKRRERFEQSLDGMYDVYKDPAQGRKRSAKVTDVLRYAFLFLCIFGFLFAGWFVFRKGYDYYRSYVINTELQEFVTEKDRFQEEYSKKTPACISTQTPQDILNGVEHIDETLSGVFTEEQALLVSKIAQLKKINPDTIGWITIDGTAVNYPMVWSEVKNYYLRRDFYGAVRSGGTIYMDERNSPDITKNRNTVIYGHNMVDGSMFAALHAFDSSSIFYGATIEIATEEGIFVYKPFSVHKSDAFDNYFETDFISDEDFVNFCEQMAFISIFQTEYTFTKDSQIITLSTCGESEAATNERFAVHAVLVQVIR